MKKNAYTLIELMVSVTILMIILGAISMVMISHTDIYKTGVKNEETGNKVQTFFSYVIGDLTPVDEVDDGKYIEIKKSGSPVYKIEIKSSWNEGNDIVYTYSDGEIIRGKYGKDEERISESKIISKSKNFDLSGMDISIKKIPFKRREGIIGEINYEEFTSEELKNGVKLSLEDDRRERFNYYIEPVLIVGNGEKRNTYTRGYGLRFAPFIDSEGPEPADGVFKSPLATYDGGQFELKVKGSIRNSYRGQVAGRIKEQNSKACTEVGGLEDGESDERTCVESDEVGRINIPKYSSLSGISSVNLDLGGSKKKLSEGIYKSDYLKIASNSGTLTIDGNVKIYLKNGADIVKGKVEYEDEDSQLLIVVTGNNEFKLGDHSQFTGYIVTYKGNITGGSRMVGGMISGREVVNIDDNGSYIKYSCKGRNITKEHIEVPTAKWW